jgi:hypothetical protein
MIVPDPENLHPFPLSKGERTHFELSGTVMGVELSRESP